MNTLRLTPLLFLLFSPFALFAGSDLSIEISNPTNQACSWTINIETPSTMSNATYSIDAGNTFQSSPSFNNVCEGRYFIHVKDAAGNLSLAKIDVQSTPLNNVQTQSDHQALIDDLTVEFNNETDLEKKNNKQWILSRHGVKFEVNLEKEVVDDKTLYSFAMLHPEGASSSSMNEEIQRILTQYSPNLEGLTVDENFNAVAIFNNSTAEQDLLAFFQFIGFDNYKIIGQ